MGKEKDELFEWGGLPDEPRTMEPKIITRPDQAMLRHKLKDLNEVSSGISALTRITKEMIYEYEDSGERLNTNKVSGLLISIEKLADSANWTLEHLNKSFKFE